MFFERKGKSGEMARIRKPRSSKGFRILYPVMDSRLVDMITKQALGFVFEEAVRGKELLLAE